MVSDQKVSVMAAYRPFLHALTIFEVKNFQNQDRRTLHRNLCYAIALLLSFSMYIVAYSSNVWYILNQEFDIAKLAFQIGIFIGGAIFIITYISIKLNHIVVNEVVANLKKIVIKRKYELGLILRSKTVGHLYYILVYDFDRMRILAESHFTLWKCGETVLSDRLIRYQMFVSYRGNSVRWCILDTHFVCNFRVSSPRPLDSSL